jgi:hypothetical protein
METKVARSREAVSEPYLRQQRMRHQKHEAVFHSMKILSSISKK